MDVIFQKKGKEMLKQGEMFQNLDKNVQNLEHSEKGQVIAYDNCTQ